MISLMVMSSQKIFSKYEVFLLHMCGKFSYCESLLALWALFTINFLSTWLMSWLKLLVLRIMSLLCMHYKFNYVTESGGAQRTFFCASDSL